MLALQVINTSLLADEQHIQQMDRQFHPARQGHSQPEPGAGADSLLQPWDASLYPSQSEPGDQPAKWSQHRSSHSHAVELTITALHLSCGWL